MKMMQWWTIFLMVDEVVDNGSAANDGWSIVVESGLSFIV